MKFNVASAQLIQQLQAVGKVINSKNSLAILENFLLKVEGDKLYITGSDSENVLTASVDIMESSGDGEIAVNAKRLTDMLKEVGSQGLTFYINDDTKEIDIRFLNGHYNFMGTPADEFPRKKGLGEGDDPKVVRVPASVVLNGIENTLFAVSTDNVRPMMTGIYWDIHEEDITFVGSNTHKLVRYINSMAKPGFATSFIMPAKPSAILRSLLTKEDNEVVVRIYEKGATFEANGYTLSCLFIQSKYPNYNRVIPESNQFELRVDRVSLLTAMRRVALFASLASSLVKLNIQPNEILLSAQDIDYAKSAEERVMCDYNGNSLVIGFNVTYLVEVLSNIKSDNVVLRLLDAARPGVVVPAEQGPDEELLMLLMPMQVIE